MLLLAEVRVVFPVETTVVDEGFAVVVGIFVVDKADDLLDETAELVLTEELALDFELAEMDFVVETMDDCEDLAVVPTLEVIPLEVLVEPGLVDDAVGDGEDLTVVTALEETPLEVVAEVDLVDEIADDCEAFVVVPTLVVTPFEVVVDLLLWTVFDVVFEDWGTVEVVTTMLDDFNTETVVVGLDVVTLLVTLDVVTGMVEDKTVVLRLLVVTPVDPEFVPVFVDETSEPEDFEERLVAVVSKELVVALLAVLEDLMIEVENPWLVVDLVEILDEVEVPVVIVLEEVFAVLVFDEAPLEEVLPVDSVCDEVFEAESVFELETGKDDLEVVLEVWD